MGNYKILVVDDNPDLHEIISTTLSKEGFDVVIAKNALEGIEKAQSEHPHLILLDVMLPIMDGFQVCSILKANRETSDIPVIFLSARDEVSDKLHGLNLGGIDYIEKPFKKKLLAARIKSLLRSRDYDINLNPLSQLPGNKAIEKYLYEMILSNKIYACGYIDIDNFKAYNDKYGFFAGDEVLKFLSKIISAAIEKYGNQEDFVGHIGGDDFVFISGISRIEDICKYIINEFDNRVVDFYSEEDVNTGFIETINRVGMKSRLPLMTLSVAVITNKNRKIEHPGKISEIATELKIYLKNFSGSNYKIDMRGKDETSLEMKDKKTVVVIESDRQIIKKFQEILDEKEFLVRYVDEGATAILLIYSLKPDYIFMNLRLPLLGGATLYKEIKNNPRLSQIPVYMYTNNAAGESLTPDEKELQTSHYLDIADLKTSLKNILK